VAASSVGFALPAKKDHAARLRGVLHVLYLTFNEETANLPVQRYLNGRAAMIERVSGQDGHRAE
jgi:predicted RNA polymerase sigma factor